MAAAVAGAAHVTLTDKEDAVGHLAANLEANVTGGSIPCGNVDTKVLEWGGALDSAHGWDVVLFSDCTYWQHLYERLVLTLRMMCGRDTVVWMAHNWRHPDKENSFFEQLHVCFDISLLEVQSEAGEVLLHKGTTACETYMDRAQPGEVMLLELSLRDGFEASATCDMDAVHGLNDDASDTQALLERIRLLEADLETIEGEPDIV